MSDYNCTIWQQTQPIVMLVDVIVDIDLSEPAAERSWLAMLILWIRSALW